MHNEYQQDIIKNDPDDEILMGHNIEVELDNKEPISKSKRKIKSNNNVNQIKRCSYLTF